MATRWLGSIRVIGTALILLTSALSAATIPPQVTVPDERLIMARPSDPSGLSLVQGFAGAVPGGSRVSIVNTITGVSVSATANSDGSFRAQIRAANWHQLSIRFSNGTNTSESISVLTFSPAIIGVTPTISGTIGDMVIAEPYGYIADVTGLRIVDLSAPASPTVVGTVITTTNATGVAVNGQYAYLTTAYSNTALKVVDVSSKTDPRVVASLFPNSGGSSVAVRVNNGRTLAYIGGYFYGKGSGLQVVDITNPLAPNALGFANLRLTPQAVTIVDRYAYIAAGSSGAVVVDVNNPDLPIQIGTFAGATQASRITFIQTSVGSTIVISTNAGLKLFNVNSPSSPLPIATALPTTVTCDVAPAGGAVVAVAAGYPGNGLLMLDLSAPASPRTIGSLRTDGEASRVCLGARSSLLSTIKSGAALNVVDTRVVTQPVKLGAIPMSSTTTSMALSGFSTLTATNTYNSKIPNRSTLVWANNSNPKKPVTTGLSNRDDLIDQVAFSESGRWALVGSESNRELQVVDVASQSVIGRVVFPLGTWVREFRVRGNLVFVAGGAAGLFIVDLGLDGRAPAIIGSVLTPGVAFGVDVAGKYAYIADNVKGIDVVDVSNPGSPSLVGANVYASGPAGHIRVRNQYLYLTLASPSLSNVWVFDLADPAVPVKIGSVTTTGGALRLAVTDGLVYVASGIAGLIILDVSNPHLPRVAKVLKTPGYCRDVEASGGLVFLADDSAVEAVVAISPTP